MTNAARKGGISACQKKSEIRTVGGGVLDAPAVNASFSIHFRRIRNISKLAVEDAGLYEKEKLLLSQELLRVEKGCP